MKNKLLIIILIAFILVACGGGTDFEDPSSDKTETKGPVTLQETGIHRYIDPELDVACYTYSVTNVSFVMSCVLVDKEELGDD